MAYCTRDNIEGKISNPDLIRLTDESGSGVVDYVKLDDAITEAEAEVDSYCAIRHTVPFQSPIPSMVIKICKDIAVYNVWSLRNAVPDDCEDRYQRAVAYLKNVAKGIVELGGDATEELDEGGPRASKSSDSRRFSMDNMEGF
jgi:phage gp36-like protein